MEEWGEREAYLSGFGFADNVALGRVLMALVWEGQLMHKVGSTMSAPMVTEVNCRGR